jgi:Bacterial Ig-like domain/Glycosyl hydrolases family 16
MASVRTNPTVSITSQKLAHDTGPVATDGITNDGTVTLSGKVTGTAGTIVRIYDGTKLIGTAALDGKGGWTFSTTLGAGSHALHATAVDTGGRTASTAAQQSILVQTTAPAVQITQQLLAQDDGVSATDRITSNGAVALSGTVSKAAGAFVQVFDGATLLGSATLDGNGGWTFATTLGTGTHALYVVATDMAGNYTVSGAQPAITVVPPGPAVQIVSQVLAQDTGLSDTDRITRNGAVTLSGMVTGAAGTVVKIMDGTVLLGMATLDGKGGWTFATTLTDGTHALTAVAVDPSGTTGTTGTQPPITVDHTAPVVSYTYEYQTAGTNTVQLFGTFAGPAGTKIDIYAGTANLGSATLNADNTWQFTTPVLPDGNYSFVAVATTPAGTSTTFSGVPSLTLGTGTSTLNTANFHTVWTQDFSTTQIDRDIFPIVYGNADQFAYGPNGLTLTSYRSEGFANVGFLQPTWGAGLGQGYGLYTVTASAGANQGAGIAILLWPTDNIWPGPELDMVENWDDPTGQTAYFSVHMKNPVDGSNLVNTIKFSVDLTKANTFSLDWENGSLTYYVNGHELFHITGSEVPKDFAHGGVNAAFGAQITDIGTSFQPTDQVSLTIYNMSYASTAPVPASIKVSNPGMISQTSPGTVVRVTETITGVALPGTTVYALVLDKNNAAYGAWQAVTLGANGTGTFMADFHQSGDYLIVATDPNNLTTMGWSAPVTLGTASNTGGVLSEAVTHDHLWFEKSGNDLIVDVLGTTQRVYINNWYANGQPPQQILASDGLKLDAGITALVQAMANFSAAHPGFNPMTTSHMSLNDIYFGTTLVAVYAGNWHP